MKLIYGIIFILIFSFSLDVFGYSYLDTQYQGYILNSFGCSKGKGEVSVISNEEFIINPSLINGNRFSINVSFLPNNEKIISEKEITYYNSDVYFQVLSFSFSYKLNKRFDIGYAFYPFSIFSYKATKYLFNEDLEKIGGYTLERIGDINTNLFGVKYTLNKIVDLGFGYKNYTGKKKEKETYFLYSSSSTSTVINEEFKGDNFVVGGYLKVGLFRIGFSLDMPLNIELKKSNMKWLFPVSYHFGFGYIYKKPYSFVGCQIDNHNWDNFKIYDGDTGDTIKPNYYTSYKVGFGLEHLINKNTVFRYGVWNEPFYEDKSIQNVGISVGFGFLIKRIFCDISYQWKRRNYYGDNAFFNDAHWIDETINDITIGMRYNF